VSRFWSSGRRVGGRASDSASRAALLWPSAWPLLLASVFGVAAGIWSTEAPWGITDAAHYLAEIEAAKAVTPLPPGATWPAWLGAVVDGSASYGVKGGQGEVEFTGACLWFGYWLDQMDNGTATSRAAALAGVEQTGGWLTFSNPLANRSLDYHAGLLNAARRGDTAPIREFVVVNCAG
jgi:hypothetical protein